MSHLTDVNITTRLTGSAGIFSRACLIALGLSMGTAVLPAAAASPDNPGYFRVHMKPGSTLNVRKTPSLKAAKVGALTADTDKIVNHGCHIGMPYLEWRKSTTAIRKVETRRKWCNIEYNGMVGWTAGQYLQADAPE